MQSYKFNAKTGRATHILYYLCIIKNQIESWKQ
jgi:hypothetical protein